MAQFPNLIDLTEPNDADTLANSNGKSAGQIVRESNAEIEAMGDVLAGPAFKNPKAATTAPAVTLANCTSLTADGPRSPAAVWTGYGEFNSPGPARSVVTSSGETYVNAVFTGQGGGWLVCNLGSDYTLAGNVALGMRIYPIRNIPAGGDRRDITDSLDIIVSDARITGVTPSTDTLITSGTLVSNPPNVALPDDLFSSIQVGLGSLTKIRAIAIHVHDIYSYATVTLRVNSLALQAATELEAALFTGATLVPETYAPSGTQAQWSLGQDRAAIDLRPDYRIIYGYGGEHHVRELQATGLEDGSAIADTMLRKAIQSLKPHDKLVFPPNATYQISSGILMRGLHDIEVDLNGATFFKGPTGGLLNTSLFSIASCSRLKMYNFSYFGYHHYVNTGDEWTPITGTTAVGATRTFTAQAHQARSWVGSGVVDGQKYIARDKDGCFVIDLELSDTNQVTKDCRVGVKTELGTTVVSTDLTLTATPTTYTVKLRARKSLHEKMQWFVYKNTATANTITLGAVKMYGAVSTAGGGAPVEGQKAINITGESDDIEIWNWYAECLPGYAFHIQAGQGFGRNIRIHDFKARCVAVQGIGIVSCTGPVEVDNFALTEVNGNGFDVEPVGTAEAAFDVRITNGYIRNTTYSAIACLNWTFVKNLVIDKIKVVNCQSFAGYGLGSVGGSVTNIYASAGIPAKDVVPALGWTGADLEIRGTNMKWSNIHLSRGFTIKVSGDGSYFGQDESNYIDGGVLRFFEVGGHHISDIFVDGGVTSADNTNAVYDGGTPASPPVLTSSGGGSNIIRDISYNSQSPLVLDSGKTARFVSISGVPEIHGLDAVPWNRAAPHVFRASGVGTPNFTPGGVQAFSEPVYDVQALSGAVATPVVWIPAATSVTQSLVLGTPTNWTGPSVPIAPDGVAEFNFELSSATGATFGALPPGAGGAYRGVAFAIEMSMDNATWYNRHNVPDLRVTGFRRTRLYTGAFSYARVVVSNYSMSKIALVSGIGNWTGTRGRNLRMLNVPVTAGATTLAATFPNRTVPPTKAWTATAATGGTLAAGAHSYRVGLRGPHSGPGIPDAARSATVVASGKVNLTAEVGVPDPATGWFANSYTFFRKNPGDTNYLWRCDVIPFDPLTNHHPISAAPWVDNGDYVSVPSGLSGYGSFPWVAIGGGGYSTAQLDSHNESGWEPDTNYGVQVQPSWATTTAVTAKRVDGLDLAFGTAAPSSATVDLFFVR